MSRAAALARVSRALGARELFWFGTRGDDVASLLDIPNFTRSFTVINAFRGSASVEGIALEDLSGIRVDLDAHDIDEDPHGEAVNQLRRVLLDALQSPAAVLTYRPSMFVSAATLTRPDARYLGLFKDHQNAFEHKPWVEAEVAALGVPSVPWKHVADADQIAAVRMLDDGPVMLRKSRSSGGTGLTKVTSPDELVRHWPTEDEAFVSVAPYLGDAVPVNVGAVVWADGITVHPLSLQLIGQEQLVDRPFGYCGNDFGRVADLDAGVVNLIEEATRRIGDWLRWRGFLGAFGLDFLVRDGEALFLEVNPRFQGSTHLSSALCRDLGESCILLDHLEAFLGLPAPDGRPRLTDWSRALPPASHLVQHLSAPGARELDVVSLQQRMITVRGYVHSDVLLPAHVACAPGATLARHVLSRSVTSTGFDLDDDIARGLSGSTALLGA